MERAIAWFTGNPVAANLLMFFLIVSGLLALVTINQEQFPNIDPRAITVSVPYLGAAPEEVEEGVCVRIEEVLKSTDGIDKLTSIANEGHCTVQLMLTDDADASAALNEVKSRVDGINTLPEETEKPVVSKYTFYKTVLRIALHGDTEERALKELGKVMREEIANLPGVSRADLTYVRPYEVSIEVSEFDLRRYGLTMEQIARAVRASSLDMPGGTIKSEGGEILLRAKGQAYWGKQFEDIVVMTRPDGTKLFLRDIASIRDTFEEGDLRARYNKQPAVVVQVWQVGKEDAIKIAQQVKKYLATKQLPPGVSWSIWGDEAAELTVRLNTLSSTALSGLALVVVILALFLKFRLAMWVAAGIPVALLGTFAVFPYADITLSSMSVMAFILVLGILVDDAIVVGERVYAYEQSGYGPVAAAVEGASEMAIPVIFGVLTTMAAFLPLIMVPGRMAEVFGVIGWVVIIALTASIIESMLILPAHLAHRKHAEPSTRFSIAWNRFQRRLAQSLENFAQHRYRPFLARCVDYRYVTASAGLGVLIIAVSLIASGRAVFAFFPAIPGDQIYATLEMPEGVSVDVTSAAARHIELAADELGKDLDAELGIDNVILHKFTTIGKLADREGGPPRQATAGRSHLAEVVLELRPAAERNNLSSKEVANRFRQKVGSIPDAVKLTFSADSFSAGEALNYQMQGNDVEKLRSAAQELREALARYEGVEDINDSFRSGKQEIKLKLLPEARTLGITLADLAGQVRSAFYGAEVQRIQRGEDEVKVMVRYPEDERTSIGNLEDMYIRTPTGVEVPFSSIARFELGHGFSTINRLNGRRMIRVTGDVDRTVVSPEEINASIQREVLPKLRMKYPAISFSLGGEQEERVKAYTGLLLASLLALILIYTLLAIPLRSYLQPMVIMSVIPFGAIGAIVGHVLMNFQLSFFSALGIVALSGVVVNASLVLVDYINRQRRLGTDMLTAVLDAGVVRFRPILLTSVTTFVGLVPMMTSTTPATMFFIPMAISLAWGVLFATVITLVIVPALYVIVDDLVGWDAVAQGQKQTGEVTSDRPVSDDSALASN
ncbi:MAG: efflux RND transporter permease subunit [Pseudomonadales bacterium]|nr:efflux RND transporter permease subunit [Pseudomonadales bacterium]MCP5185486.1 efflux RND transporter permease subunit [Pseudomonadales bacterium]